MVNKVVENLIKAAEKNLDNARRIELALTKKGLVGDHEIFREIKEVRKYEQWIKNIDKEFKEIDNHFKQIMGRCANIYHALLEELKREGYEKTDLYRRVAKIHNIFESLHKKGLSSDKLLREEFPAILNELNNIKREMGNNQYLRSLFNKYSGEIDREVRGRLNGYVINKIVEIDNNIKNLINRIKKIYGHLSSLSRTKTYENIHKEIAKDEKELHKEIVELEKLHEEIKILNAALVNFEKQISLKYF
jgi:DNA repair exonuclease SbcCD ATPase subunit